MGEITASEMRVAPRISQTASDLGSSILGLRVLAISGMDGMGSTSERTSLIGP